MIASGEFVDGAFMSSRCSRTRRSTEVEGGLLSGAVARLQRSAGLLSTGSRATTSRRAPRAKLMSPPEAEPGDAFMLKPTCAQGSFVQANSSMGSEARREAAGSAAAQREGFLCFAKMRRAA